MAPLFWPLCDRVWHASYYGALSPAHTPSRATPPCIFSGICCTIPTCFAFFVGIFVAFIPLPGQMPIAALLALLLHCNLPISVALVWISNPLTMPAIFFSTYQLGRWLLELPPVQVSLELSWHWLMHEFSLIWKPLLVGSLLSGLVFGVMGYVVMQLFWRWTVVKSWQRRKLRRRSSPPKPDH